MTYVLCVLCFGVCLGGELDGMGWDGMRCVGEGEIGRREISVWLWCFLVELINFSILLYKLHVFAHLRT